MLFGWIAREWLVLFGWIACKWLFCLCGMRGKILRGLVGAVPMCPPVSPYKGASIVQSPRIMRVFGMETPLRGRSGGYAGAAPTIPFGWIVRGTVGGFEQIARGRLMSFGWIACGRLVALGGIARGCITEMVGMNHR